MKKLFCLLTIVFLSACSVNRAGPEKTVNFYDLGPAKSPASAPAFPGLTLEIRLPPWLDSAAIQYRLGYHDVNRLHEYALARWITTPALLLQQRLRQQVGLVNAADSFAPPCILSLELQEFGQNFSSAAVSTVSISGEARLLSRSRRVLASRTIAIEQFASTDAAGAVRALSVASDALGEQLREWMLAQAKTERLGVCRAD